MTDACRNFHDLTLGYNGHPAVHHLSDAVRNGLLTVAVGTNGSGKFTSMNAVDEQAVADLSGLIKNRHHGERTIVVVANDLDLIRAHFIEAAFLFRYGTQSFASDGPAAFLYRDDAPQY